MTDDQPDYTAMTGPDLLKALGTDARLWAKAFCQHAFKFVEESPYETPLPEDWVHMWFANAFANQHEAIMPRRMDGVVVFCDNPTCPCRHRP